MIEKCNKKISIVQQCELLEISRSGFYYEKSGEKSRNLEIMKHP